MFRRRPIIGPRRGPGVLGTVARTAVIAGTATAVSRGVSNSMDQKAQVAQQQQEAQAAVLQSQADIAQIQGQLAAMQAQQTQAAIQSQATPAATPPLAGGDLMAQLQQLAQLKEAGMLTDEEFSAAKARLLAG